MKKILFILLLAPVLAFGQHLGRYPVSHGYATVAPGYDYTSLEHWYPLISDYNDAHGSDNGTNTGASQGDSTINSVNATYFNESEDDYVTLTTGTNHGSSTFSAFGTCKAHSRTTNDGMYVGASGSACLVIDASGHPVLLDRGGNYVTSTLTVPIGAEVFVGWSYAQDRNKVRFYVNGSTEVLNFSDTFSASTTGIGGATTDFSWDGLWQNIAIWSDSLTEENFDYYYNSGDFKGYEE